MNFVLDGESLTPAELAEVARSRMPVSLADAGRRRNEQAHQSTRALQQAGAAVYGMSTGVGALKTESLGSIASDEQQLRLLRSHAGGAGEPVSAELGRATLAVRINQLARGGAGVHPSLLDGLLHALNSGAAPQFRQLGSVGTGDLGALAEIGLALLGQRPMLGLEPVPGVTLGPRDGLMLMSSNAHAVAEAALACADLSRLLVNAEAVAALSFEAARAEPSALDARVHQHRPHPGQISAAANLRSLLEGYSGTARLQDSFAFRCLPQVQGPLREALDYLEHVVRIELNAGAENALVTDGVALANGNFHAAPLALALDFARNALAQAASLGACRLSDLLDPKVTGLTAFLAERPGPDSGLMILEYTAQAAVAELKTLAQPATQAATLSMGIENHASFATLAARHATRAVKLWRVTVACELVAALRALRLRQERPKARGNRALFEWAMASLPGELADRPTVEDLDRAGALLEGQLA
ncbi:MAG: aromatic amino acid lyase [Archangiaceae bacterium]|nr:aromatic amino acid lyase [Archangiaceae bacterium]